MSSFTLKFLAKVHFSHLICTFEESKLGKIGKNKKKILTHETMQTISSINENNPFSFKILIIFFNEILKFIVNIYKIPLMT